MRTELSLVNINVKYSPQKVLALECHRFSLKMKTKMCCDASQIVEKKSFSFQHSLKTIKIIIRLLNMQSFH